MKKYQVVDLTEGAFASPHTVEATSPKEAAEKVLTGNKVKRVTSGGSIVVYGVSQTRTVDCVKSYVYEFANE